MINPVEVLPIYEKSSNSSSSIVRQEEGFVLDEPSSTDKESVEGSPSSFDQWELLPE